MANELQPFTVIYVEEGILIWQFFNCMAEDDDHAEEQCQNAYPQGTVLWVNMGHDNKVMCP